MHISYKDSDVKLENNAEPENQYKDLDWLEKRYQSEIRNTQKMMN